MENRWTKILVIAVKAALGAAVSIVLAGLLGLTSPMTAGIIAVLSIQGTKQATWRVAGERVLAFVCANAIAFAAFSLLGYGLAGFTAYLFVYAVVCVCLGWMHALAPVSVLVTHYVTAGGMPVSLIGNEALLLLIGAGVGMLVNLHLHPRRAAMDRLAAGMDSAMIAALRALAEDPQNDAPFRLLEDSLNQAAALAEENRANRLLGGDDGDTAYVLLRRSQMRVLMQMRAGLLEVTCRPPQYDEVCRLLEAVADAYHRQNDVVALLEKRSAVLEDMKRQALPVSREEFESRAVLYNVLLQLEDFLVLKNDYFRSIHQEKLLDNA